MGDQSDLRKFLEKKATHEKIAVRVIRQGEEKEIEFSIKRLTKNLQLIPLSPEMQETKSLLERAIASKRYRFTGPEIRGEQKEHKPPSPEQAAEKSAAAADAQVRQILDDVENGRGGMRKDKHMRLPLASMAHLSTKEGRGKRPAGTPAAPSGGITLTPITRHAPSPVIRNKNAQSAAAPAPKKPHHGTFLVPMTDHAPRGAGPEGAGASKGSVAHEKASSKIPPPLPILPDSTMGPDPGNWVDAVCRQLITTPDRLAGGMGITVTNMENYRWGGMPAPPNTEKIIKFAKKHNVSSLLPASIQSKAEAERSSDVLLRVAQNAHGLIGKPGSPPFQPDTILRIYSFLKMHFLAIRTQKAVEISLRAEELLKLARHAAELLKKAGLDSTPKGSHLTASFLEEKRRPHIPQKPSKLRHMNMAR